MSGHSSSPDGDHLGSRSQVREQTRWARKSVHRFYDSVAEILGPAVAGQVHEGDESRVTFDRHAFGQSAALVNDVICLPSGPGRSLWVTSAGVSQIMTISEKRRLRDSFRRRNRRPVGPAAARGQIRSRHPRPHTRPDGRSREAPALCLSAEVRARLMWRGPLKWHSTGSAATASGSVMTPKPRRAGVWPRKSSHHSHHCSPRPVGSGPQSVGATRDRKEVRFIFRVRDGAICPLNAAHGDAPPGKLVLTTIGEQAPGDAG